MQKCGQHTSSRISKPTQLLYHLLVQHRQTNYFHVTECVFFGFGEGLGQERGYDDNCATRFSRSTSRSGGENPGHANHIGGMISRCPGAICATSNNSACCSRSQIHAGSQTVVKAQNEYVDRQHTILAGRQAAHKQTQLDALVQTIQFGISTVQQQMAVQPAQVPQETPVNAAATAQPAPQSTNQ